MLSHGGIVFCFVYNLLMVPCLSTTLQLLPLCCSCGCQWLHSGGPCSKGEAELLQMLCCLLVFHQVKWLLACQPFMLKCITPLQKLGGAKPRKCSLDGPALYMGRMGLCLMKHSTASARFCVAVFGLSVTFLLSCLVSMFI